ncbi:hypothetical protein ACRQGT_09205 [Actinotignum sp. GS-2025c]
MLEGDVYFCDSQPLHSGTCLSDSDTSLNELVRTDSEPPHDYPLPSALINSVFKSFQHELIFSDHKKWGSWLSRDRWVYYVVFWGVAIVIAIAIISHIAAPEHVKAMLQGRGNPSFWYFTGIVAVLIMGGAEGVK